MNVRDFMRRSAGFHRDRPAIVAGQARLTYAQAWERGCRMANWLRSLGLQPGDRVGSLEPNNLEAVDFFLGAAIANVVRVPLYARNARASHRAMLEQTGCTALVVSEVYEDQVAGMAQEIASLRHVIVRRPADYEQRLASFPATDPGVPVRDEDGYVLRHTGGTTGKPRGVLFTQKSWLEIGRNWFFTMPPVAEGDVCLHIAPISHASGYQFVPVWLMGGVNLLVEKFEAPAIADLMEQERVGYVFMAPTMVQDMLQVKGLAERDWSALKVLLIGAAPITEATARRAHAVWGDALCQLYGQTEGVPATMTMASEWIRDVPGSQPLRSLGKVHPFCELEIRDPDSHAPLPFGEVGEICYKSDGQMTGYWEDAEATAEHLLDGWVMTGDVGFLDANGYVYLLDRKDDMILSGGFNIWPTELENVLATHPAIVEVVVFGIPHERFGEVPHAVCRLAEGADASEAELIELCARELGSYKKPARVDLRREPLPRTPVGKVSRKQLRAPFWAGTGRTK